MQTHLHSSTRPSYHIWDSSVNSTLSAFPLFEGRGEVLARLHQYFQARERRAGESLKQRTFVLFGLGGAGKTQIALKFADEAKDM
jgi:hypothetical protein